MRDHARIKLPKPKNEGGLIGNINNHPTQVSGPHKSQESPHLLSYNTTQHTLLLVLRSSNLNHIVSHGRYHRHQGPSDLRQPWKSNRRGSPSLPFRYFPRFCFCFCPICLSSLFPPHSFVIFVIIFHFTPHRYLFIYLIIRWLFSFNFDFQCWIWIWWCTVRVEYLEMFVTWLMITTTTTGGCNMFRWYFC